MIESLGYAVVYMVMAHMHYSNSTLLLSSTYLQISVHLCWQLNAREYNLHVDICSVVILGVETSASFFTLSTLKGPPLVATYSYIIAIYSMQLSMMSLHKYGISENKRCCSI